VGCLKLSLRKLLFLDIPPQPVYISLVFSSMVSELKERLSRATSKMKFSPQYFCYDFSRHSSIIKEIYDHKEEEEILDIGKVILGIIFLAASIWILIQADSTTKYLLGGFLVILSLILVIRGLKKKAK
jgi:hypothetical protein